MFQFTKRRSVAVFGALALATALAAFAGAGCAARYPARSPLGESFPRVEAQSLAGEPVQLPPPQACVLLIGYVQKAQFDLDRWLLGLLQADLGLRIYEVPTIPGLLASGASGWIDDGMRSGIPPEDWKSVVTVYGSKAEPIAKLTGNEPTRNGRVLLLDAEGRVQWMHDRGYSASKLLELAARARELALVPSAPSDR
ncbi:MAG: hypothetical protein JNN27_14065 [Planctomycetes bacterium]|nr:hypothetical protein [Planctomycetota bacterium]